MKKPNFNTVKASKSVAFLTLLLLLVGSGLYFNLDANQKQQTINANPKDFSVMTWNVENFFDLNSNGTEYPEFIPNFKGWTKEAYETKLNNISEVIKDANPDILALQEVENEDALEALKTKLGTYDYSAITHKKNSAVQIALLSRFPIKQVEEIGDGVRPILKSTLDINGTDFVIYTNHWRAKPSPESKRVESAEDLKLDIAKIQDKTPYILVGDFNENYNECFNFDAKLNDTNGVIGLAHIIETAKSKPNNECKLAAKADILIQSEPKLHYDAWLELNPSERWSEVFGKEYGTLDHIILSKNLFSDKGISYQDESFKVFKPSYMLKKGRPYRWNTANKTGEINEGYSDHLPLIAKFSKSPFVPNGNKVAPLQKTENNTTAKTNQNGAKKISINDIYKADELRGDFLLTNAVVIYKAENMAVIKEPKSRAIEVYNAPNEWSVGNSVDIRFSEAKKWHGKTEISKIFDFNIGKKQDIQNMYLTAKDANLSDPKYENEIISGFEGLISRGKFYYGDNEQIKIYFKNKDIKPKGMTKIKINHAQISNYENEPQIIIRQNSDFSLVGK